MKIQRLRNDLGSFWANLEIWHKVSVQQSLPQITSRMYIAFFLLSLFMFQQLATSNMPSSYKNLSVQHTNVCMQTHIHCLFRKIPCNLNKNCFLKQRIYWAALAQAHLHKLFAEQRNFTKYRYKIFCCDCSGYDLFPQFGIFLYSFQSHAYQIKCHWMQKSILTISFHITPVCMPVILACTTL